MASRRRPGRGRRSPAACAPCDTSWPWTSAVTASRTPRPKTARMTSTGWPRTWSPSRRGRACWSSPGDRMVLAGHGFGAMIAAEAALALGARVRGRRAGRWRLGGPRGLDRPRCRRVPARARRTARGHAVDDGVPRRSGGVRSRDLGRGPGTGGPGDRRRDARGPRRAGHATARARGVRPNDVRLRPDGDGPGHRGARGHRSPRPDRATTHRAPGIGRWTRWSRHAHAAGNPTARIVPFRHDGHNLMRYRPDAVSAAILGVAGRV